MGSISFVLHCTKQMSNLFLCGSKKMPSGRDGNCASLTFRLINMRNAALQQGKAVVSSSFFKVQSSFSLPKAPISLAAFSKIAVDVVLCTILLVVLAPVMGAIAIAVAVDGGPVLFTHQRIGKGGERFYCLKFRSMVMSADEVLDRYLANDPVACKEWRATQKLTNDPRVTRVGKFLRATSMDELPQLFNVLRLEMSLVGPRPIVENELPRYGKSISYYLQARPGVTGLWQVSGRSNTSYARRVALDAWYVKSWRFWRDLGILLRTIPAVLRREGAR